MIDTSIKDIALTLLDVRTSRHMTQEDFAKQIDLSPSELCDIENRYKSPSKRTMDNIRRYLKSINYDEPQTEGTKA